MSGADELLQQRLLADVIVAHNHQCCCGQGHLPRFVFGFGLSVLSLHCYATVLCCVMCGVDSLQSRLLEAQSQLEGLSAVLVRTKADYTSSVQRLAALRRL